MSKLQLRIDRAAREPVSEQIAAGLRAAIREGRLCARSIDTFLMGKTDLPR